MWRRLAFLLKISRSRGIVRRYFVVNGFDGALTMLGLCMGFYVSGEVDLRVVNSACLGAAVALGMSGLTSAYVSESAEKQRELRALEAALLADLSDSAHAEAARMMPLVTALVNGLAPLLLGGLIIVPVWLGLAGISLPLAPLEAAIAAAFAVIFMLGIFLGRVSDTFWLTSGLRTLLIAVVTAFIILLINS